MGSSTSKLQAASNTLGGIFLAFFVGLAGMWFYQHSVTGLVKQKLKESAANPAYSIPVSDYHPPTVTGFTINSDFIEQERRAREDMMNDIRQDLRARGFKMD